MLLLAGCSTVKVESQQKSETSSQQEIASSSVQGDGSAGNQNAWSTFDYVWNAGTEYGPSNIYSIRIPYIHHIQPFFDLYKHTRDEHHVLADGTLYTILGTSLEKSDGSIPEAVFTNWAWPHCGDSECGDGELTQVDERVFELTLMPPEIDSYTAVNHYRCYDSLRNQSPKETFSLNKGTLTVTVSKIYTDWTTLGFCAEKKYTSEGKDYSTTVGGSLTFAHTKYTQEQMMEILKSFKWTSM